MKIKVIVIGKTHKNFLVEGENEYLKRIKRYVNIEKVEIPDIKNARKMSQAEIRQKEGQLILQKTDSGSQLVLLDDKGEMYSSMKFSKWLQNKMNRGHKTLVFVIGGAYGFSDEVYQRANEQVSLSKMTFSHQMIRMLFFEQVYRAFSILNHEPYHHE